MNAVNGVRSVGLVIARLRRVVFIVLQLFSKHSPTSRGATDAHNNTTRAAIDLRCKFDSICGGARRGHFHNRQFHFTSRATALVYIYPRAAYITVLTRSSHRCGRIMPNTIVRVKRTAGHRQWLLTRSKTDHRRPALCPTHNAASAVKAM